MPKKLDLPGLIKELDAAPENGFYSTYIKLPVGLARDVAALANRRGTTLFTQFRESLEQSLSVSFGGVAIKLDPATLKHLDTAAEHLGLSREGLASAILAEHLDEYLAKGLAKLKHRRAIAEEIAREAEATERASPKPAASVSAKTAKGRK